MDTEVKVGEVLQDGFKSSLKTLKKGVAAVNASFEPPCLWKCDLSQIAEIHVLYPEWS